MKYMQLCNICRHRVRDMDKHRLTKEHILNASGKERKQFGARLPGMPKSGIEDTSPLPGRIRLGKRK